jgi:hypothetical protein
MTSSTELRAMDFHGDQVVTFESGGVRYVAMRRIVENMGLAWQSQHPKLLQQTVKFNCHDIITMAADGKERGMLCMPVEKLPLWLACINSNKVRDGAVRVKIELYQSESAVALHDFWTKGIAVKGDAEGIVALPGDVMEYIRRTDGISRMLSHKVTEMEKTLVTVSSAMSAIIGIVHPDHPVLIRRGKTAGQIWRDNGYPPLKGVGAWFGNRLKLVGCQIENNGHAEMGLCKARLFDPDRADQWLQEGGGSLLVRQKISERKGQGRLSLVEPKQPGTQP